MPLDLVRAPGLTDQVGYAYAAVTPATSLVFTAGACPLDDDGAVVAPGDVAARPPVSWTTWSSHSLRAVAP